MSMYQWESTYRTEVCVNTQTSSIRHEECIIDKNDSMCLICIDLKLSQSAAIFSSCKN